MAEKIAEIKAGHSPALEVENVSFRYSLKRSVFLFSSLKIERGEKVFLFGPSGSGKTTLLGLIAGVLAPNSGVIRLLGTDTGALSQSKRDDFRGNHVGYLFQQFNLIPYLSVLENILLPCELNPKRGEGLPRSLLKERALEITDALGIKNLLSVPVTELSVGQQQRVAAARALLGSPEILIADEPTSALDFDHREAFLKLLFRECEKRKLTLLFVSHDRTLEKLFDRSISLLDIRSETLPEVCL
jgi:putative ABC transport system ATP-binding protein